MYELDIVGIGAMNLDQIYTVDSIVEDQEGIIKKAISNPGGSAANTIYGLAKLGCNTGFVGSVGSDKAGMKLIKDLKDIGVDTSQIVMKQRVSTGTAICLTDKQGRRSIYINPGANSRLNMHDIDMKYIRKAKLVFLSSFADVKQLKVQKQIVNQTDAEQRIIFSPGNIYTKKGLAELYDLLKHTYLFLTNHNEIHVLTGNDFASGAKTCLKAGCKIVVVTFGEGINLDNETFSSIIFKGNSEYRIKAFKNGYKKRFDTIGAGDAFAVGFIFGLLNNKNIIQCGLLGRTIANLSINTVGARKGLPDYPKLATEYESMTGNSI